MRWKCLLCGKEYEQPPSTPVKLYCSEHCLNRQYNNRLIPPEVVAAEKDRRRKLLGNAQKSPEERSAYNRRKRQEYVQREAEIYAGCDEPHPTRYCHNFYVKGKNGEPLCRNRTWDYYCPECHRKKRRKAGLDMDREETESEWDGF
jgi:hypothetical protein